MAATTEPEWPDLQSVLKQYRTWCLRNTPEDQHNDRATLLIALVRPDGRIVTAMPSWTISEEDSDEEAFRKSVHGWLDAVLAKRNQPESELDGVEDEQD